MILFLTSLGHIDLLAASNSFRTSAISLIIIVLNIFLLLHLSFIHTNVVVKKVGPNCSGTDNFWKSGEAKWSLAAARTNWRNLEL